MAETNTSNIGFEKQIWTQPVCCGAIWMLRSINPLSWV